MFDIDRQKMGRENLLFRIDDVTLDILLFETSFEIGQSEGYRRFGHR